MEEQKVESTPLEDRSLVQIDVPLTIQWISDRMAEGLLLAKGSQDGLPWREIQVEPEESDNNRIKSIVNPIDYSKIEVEQEDCCYGCVILPGSSSLNPLSSIVGHQDDEPVSPGGCLEEAHIPTLVARIGNSKYCKAIQKKKDCN